MTLLHPGEPLRPHDLATADAWPLEWPVVAGLLLAAWLYARGVRRLWARAGRGRGVAPWRAWAFAGGLAFTAVALLTPLAAAGNALFSVHMLQHVVLMLVAAPLLVLGAASHAVPWALPMAGRRAVGRVVRARPLRRAWRAVTHPLSAWTIHAAAVLAWHVPALFELTLTSEAAHVAQHLSFFGTALLFWAPLARRGAGARLDAGAGVLYLFTTGVYGAALGAYLTLADGLLYPAYAERAVAWGLTPLEDQQLAGLVMWVPSGFVYAGAGLLLLLAWLRDADRAVRAASWRSAASRAALLVLVAAVAGGCAGDDAADDGAVRAVFVDASDGTGPDARAARGATMAAEEAARVGDLVGRRFALAHVRAATAGGAVREAAALLDDGAVAVIGGFDPATCAALDSLAAASGALWVNVGCTDVAARDPGRHPRAFHVAATESMLRGAGTAAGAARPTLWHAGLSRYGAAQLNERFARRFDAPMEGPEWAGWMAVKVIAEAALRATGGDTARVVSADTIAAYLVRSDVAFDGHKGEPLRFGADDHQLRQPVYVVGAGGAPAAADDGPAAPAMGLPRVADRSVPLLVVSNEGSSSVTVLDARDHAVVGVIPLGHRPRGIHAAPDGSRVYVATSDPAPNAQGDGDAIVALDPRTGRVLDRIRAGSDPEQFALSPDGSHLYAANEDAGLATVTDLRAGEERASLAVGIEPEGVAVSPDGRWAYVAAETSNTVSVIDTRANRVVASFLVDVRPRDVAFAPDGRRAYVTNEIAATVSVVDVARHAVIATIPLERASKPVGVVVSPDSRRVFVALGGAHAVVVIDAAAGAVATNVPVGRRPWGVALSPDGGRLYTANGVSGDVSVVDTDALRVVATVPVGERPWGVAWVPGVRR